MKSAERTLHASMRRGCGKRASSYLIVLYTRSGVKDQTVHIPPGRINFWVDYARKNKFTLVVTAYFLPRAQVKL